MLMIKITSSVIDSDSLFLIDAFAVMETLAGPLPEIVNVILLYLFRPLSFLPPADLHADCGCPGLGQRHSRK